MKLPKLKSRTHTHREKKGGSVGKNLTIVSTICIIAASFATALVFFSGSNRMVTMIMQDDTQYAMTSLQAEIDSLKKDAEQHASDFAGNDDIVSAMNPKLRGYLAENMKMVIQNTGADVDFMTITDESGNVLASTSSGQTGGSLSGLQSVKEAVLGHGTKAYVETGFDDKLAVRAAAAIRDSHGKVLGMLSTGYSMDKVKIVDSLKQANGCEFTVFLNDVRYNTTIQAGDKRQLGTKLDPSIANVVIGGKKAFEGETTLLGVHYYSRYQPITGPDGKVIGAYFAGKPIARIKSLQTMTDFFAVAAAIVVSAISILIFMKLSRKRIARPIQKMSQMAAEMADGNLDAAEVAVSSNDEIGQLGKSLGTMAFHLQRYVKDISHQLSVMAKGDMTAEFDMEYIGDFKPIQSALQKISDSLNRTLARIDQSAQQVSSSASQVSSGSQELAQGASEQTGSVQELSAAIEDVSQKVAETTGKVRSMTQTVANAVEDVGSSNRKAEHMLAAMTGIRQSSDQIGKIIKSIDDIAFQTNILALNAAVEAARAGEAGKGFAVVADEVRNLAAKSAEASKETAALIHDTLEKVQNGFELAEDTAASSRQIHTKLQQLTGDMDEIDRTSASETAAVGRIRHGIAQVSSVVQTNSATAEESAAASEELSGQAALLREEVGKFHLKS